MKRALVVGIDYYQNLKSLHGCVNDATQVKNLLEYNQDGSPNFDLRLMKADRPETVISRKELKENIVELFQDSEGVEVALFYFAGHGFLENTGGYLVPSSSKDGDDGLPMAELLMLANQSKAKNKIIILDCCHGGYLGKPIAGQMNSELGEGLTILTASSEVQYAMEENGSGVFTSLFVDALKGGAADVIGNITPGSVYAHIDQSLGSWEQRPIFKTNVSQFITLRKITPAVRIEDLRELTSIFPQRDEIFDLDPTYEDTFESNNISKIEERKERIRVFKILQSFNRVNLVVPVGAVHMYYAAMNSKGCILTALGKHYWNLAKKGRI